MSSLATRCPRCQTVFRVVPDQLRVSEGWVRCGRCSDVFNASRHMVDPSTGEIKRSAIEVHARLPEPVAPEMERTAPFERPEPAAWDRAATRAPGRGVSDAATGTPPEPAAASPAGAAGPGSDDDTAGIVADADPAFPAAPPAAAIDAELGADVGPDAGTPRSAPAPLDEPPAARPGRRAEGAAGAAAARATGPGALPASLPSFVRRAQRAERWQRPGVRLLLGLGVLLAAATLAAQALYTFRDHVAARWPETQPLLVAACASLGCRIEPLRAIEALVVESSGLVRVEKSEVYRLGVAMRNQRELDVAMPAIDLSLTDTQGRLIARRVLRASELGATTSTLAAGAELALNATLRVAGAPVAGYTIELFYP